jgi:outer membrane protein assembly factor BamB
MAYADGRVYAVGSTMRVRCLDAGTGERVWEQPLGPITKALEADRADGSAKGHRIRMRNRDWGFAPVVHAGSVITNDMSGGVVAFDAKTGRLRWRTPKVAWKNSTVHPWSPGGRATVIVAGLPAISCLDATDGSALWRIPASCYRGITVSGDLLAYRESVGPPDGSTRDPQNAKDPANHVCVVMQLDLQEPRQLWHTPLKPKIDGKVVKEQFSNYVRPQIVDGRLYLSGGLWTDCFDARTGKHLARLKAKGGVRNAGHLMSAHGRLLSVVDGKHGTTRIAVYTTDPGAFRPTGPDAEWTPPHPNTTSYGPCMLHPVVDGRIFIRGHDAVYCYDLRKRAKPE